MIQFVVTAALAMLALLVLTRGQARELLLAGICIVSLNNLFLPFHELPIGGARGLLLLTLVGLAVLYFLAVDVRGGEGLQYRLPRLVSGYGVGLILLVVILFGYLLLTRNPAYGMTKVRNLMLFTLLPVAALSLFTPFRRHELRLMAIVLGIGALLVAAQLALSPQDFGTWATRKSIGGEVHPNNVARNIGLGLPIVVGALLAPRRLRLLKLLGLLVCFFFLGVITIITGSRGPLLAAGCAIVAFMVFMLLSTRSVHMIPRFLKGAALGALVTAVLYNTYLKEQQNLTRIILYATTIGANTSDMSRLERYRVAWDGFIDSKLVGVGPGGFTALWEGPPPGGIFDQRDYPHNFLLEIAAEAGLPGLLVVSAMIVGLLVTVVMRHRRLSAEELPYAGVFVALWVYAFMNSSVSGDIATNFQMWVSGALVWLIFSRGIEEHMSEEFVPEGEPRAALMRGGNQ